MVLSMSSMLNSGPAEPDGEDWQKAKARQRQKDNEQQTECTHGEALLVKYRERQRVILSPCSLIGKQDDSQRQTSVSQHAWRPVAFPL